MRFAWGAGWTGTELPGCGIIPCMPANLTPDYQRAEQRYRASQTPDEKLAALEEMLRTLPKHKGTEKIQAELKRKISAAREASVAHKKGGGKDPFHVPPQGAGQVVLLGPPNVGKSAIVQALTDAPVKVAEFPFSTHAPVPGMAYYEDCPIQLVDMPPLTPEHMPGGMIGAIRNADIVAIVGNLAADSVLEDLDAVLSVLRERRLRLLSRAVLPAPGDEEPEPRRGLIVANQCDRDGAKANLAALRELIDSQLEIVPVSAASGENLDLLVKTLFGLLHVVRVYAKPPGKPPDKSAPFIIPVGSTVHYLAGHIHKELAAKLKFARLWGDNVFPGQQVNHDHVLHDKDVVEIHV
jgi:ribosome-interacting GTPase 1